MELREKSKKGLALAMTARKAFRRVVDRRWRRRGLRERLPRTPHQTAPNASRSERRDVPRRSVTQFKNLEPRVPQLKSASTHRRVQRRATQRARCPQRRPVLRRRATASACLRQPRRAPRRAHLCPLPCPATPPLRPPRSQPSHGSTSSLEVWVECAAPSSPRRLTL